jgi:hypothetical protein
MSSGRRWVAAPAAIGYKTRMPCRILARILALLCLVVLTASLGGCTKCGFFWEDWQQRACHSDAPR